MKIVLAPEFRQLSGHDGNPGGFVFLSLMGMQCARLHVMPAQPQAADQVLIRSYMTTASQAFGSLTDAERALWETYANLNVYAHLGYNYTLSAIMAYVQVNVYRQIDGQATSDAAPTSLAGFSASLLDTFAYNSGTTVFTVDCTHNGTDGVGFWAVSLTPALASAQRAARPSDYRLADAVAIGSIVPVTTSPQTITITTPKYTWLNDQYMAVKVIPLGATYNKGTETTAKAQVTVT